MTVSRRAFLAAALLAAGCSGDGGGQPVLRLVTGAAGGAYEMLGSRFAPELRRVGFDVRVVPTAASVQNLAMLAVSSADLGFALADSADDAVRVRGLAVAALARMYMNYVHLVVPAGSSIMRPDDLKGTKVSIGAEGSGTAVTAQRVLAALPHLPSAVKLGLDASLKALDGGSIDAFFWSGGVPTPALAARGGLRLVPLGELVAALRREHGPVYELASVPVGVYGGAAPVPTIGTPSYLVCRAGLAEDVVFTVTETLFASRDRLEAPDAPGGRLDKRYAIGTGGVPLHPGAARYYRSVYG